MTKKLIPILFLFFFVKSMGIVSGQSNDSDIIIIRGYTPLSTSISGSIKIYKSNDQVESVYLSSLTEKDDNGVFIAIRKTLNRYTKEGYTIISSHESVGGERNVIFTYVLEKK